ncbi:DUF3267 domain-containing protein [Cytobacillus spongiae]|jgi:hypothetical protein|uniref:DUF3267 domain-containing protein n=1 Tax=Cytobacillus spongiae TaxID=2901381 RepID=UPI001F1702E1|nr:DUF3267 domain-containing protein [Cytobacillus spongiae]UII57891.1 DUF3267 domain-containing protein [Cytobacillus spongiae]
MDLSEWTPFIQKEWFRHHFMKLVYLLQFIILLIPSFLPTEFTSLSIVILILIGILTFIIHESLHFLVIYRKGDMSLTFSGIFFWIHTNATLSKARFLIFMSLPFIALSVVPVLLSFFVTDHVKILLLFVGWLNALISASDLINSILIMIKPANSVFCRGYYRVKQV